MKKGIKGRLLAPLEKNTIKYIKENVEVFKAVIDSDFDGCAIEYEIYEAEYEDKDVIGIDFNILAKTVKEAEQYYKKFKYELKNHFGFKLNEHLKLKYDRI